MNIYNVKTIRKKEHIAVEVPGSKSITNRALMLAALSNKECTLKGVLFSDDSRAFLDCLEKLGFDIKIDENKKVVKIKGLNGVIPNSQASINVRSAGTAARFLTVMLAVAGGHYTLESSQQMRKRPMKELIEALRHAGITIKCIENEGYFPFEIHSEGLNTNKISINTDISSQYASALLMSAVNTNGMKVQMTGERTNGAYINITLTMMKQFGIHVSREEDTCYIPGDEYGISEYQIEPDMSGACYFYAMAPLLKADILVKNLHLNSMQGDVKFIQIMKQLGCKIVESDEGVHVDGRMVESFEGIEVDMKDFSDQTMTMAVVAAFATSPTCIKNIGHIKFQETDRVNATVTELNRMGIKAHEIEENGQTNIFITPGKIESAVIETYDDHRMAMSFALAGLAASGISISDPECCAKTFENYFDIIEEITK